MEITELETREDCLCAIILKGIPVIQRKSSNVTGDEDTEVRWARLKADAEAEGSNTNVGDVGRLSCVERWWN